jgi:hypothetical protein
MKKGDEVADDEDDDEAVRTSVLQDQMRATIYTEESSVYIALPAYQRGQPMIRTVNMAHTADTTSLHTSLQDITTYYKVFNETKFFLNNYFMTGQDTKAIFSISEDTHCRKLWLDAVL